MTKEEFLAKVGLHQDELRDLVEKFDVFEDGLNAAQQAAVRRSMRPQSEALHSLGGNLTPAKLNKILKGIGIVGRPDEDPGNLDTGQFNGRSIFAGKGNGQTS